nr:hypothetical protein [Tanacetum cinerariifolium]
MREEANTLRSCIAQLTAVIAKLQAMEDLDEAHDSLLAAKDAKRTKQGKLTALNDVIAKALDEIKTQEANVEILEAGSNDPSNIGVFTCTYSFRSLGVEYGTSFEHVAFLGYIEICFCWRISKSKKRSLVIELEARVERGDPARHVEYMREIFSCDSELLGELEKLLTCAQVGVGLKDGSVVEDYRLAREINRVTVEVQNVVSVRAEFIEELDSLGVRHVPPKLAKFLKQIQRKDQETMTQLQILEREMEFNASKKELLIKKLEGLVPF